MLKEYYWKIRAIQRVSIFNFLGKISPLAIQTLVMTILLFL